MPCVYLPCAMCLCDVSGFYFLSVLYPFCLPFSLCMQVWPGTTAFPDFLHPNATQWWQDQIAAFLASVPIDGLWYAKE